ncbi:MAG: hypothetical protein AAF968_06370 [Pseudomonadota bacterium]
MSEEDITVSVDWTGEGLRLARGMARAFRGVEPGERLVATLRRPRSQASHNHYFAEIGNAFANIPEFQQDQPWAATPETMRKHALIAEQYCQVQAIDAGSNAAAERVRIGIRAVLMDYSVILVRGSSVVVYTAESQSMKAMGKARFQASKDAVLSWIAANVYGVPA